MTDPQPLGFRKTGAGQQLGVVAPSSTGTPGGASPSVGGAQVPSKGPVAAPTSDENADTDANANTAGGRR